MLFNSFQFLFIFLPVVVLGNGLLRHFSGARAAQLWLLAASLFFYAWPRPEQLPLLLASIVVNWAILQRMGAAGESETQRQRWLWIGLVANIGFLATFKYVNFALGQLNALAGTHVLIPNWDSPLGISFFTLTQVMFLVDCHQQMSKPVSLVDHASAVSFFPYVSSGPLVRVGEISEQFAAGGSAGSRLDLARRGLLLLAMGLVKKVVIADSLARVANAGFGAAHLSTLEAWAFSLSYTFQIYFDFSGYSDMAVAVAWLLGYQIPQNFNTPYVSKSISEFWQRWHISLSNFITSYLFTPILRSFRKATIRSSMVATLIAMTIAGLWHGPAWTYVVFGVIHGAALGINQYWKRSKRKLPPGAGWLLTFLLVNAAFVVFRSPDLPAAGAMLLDMIPHGGDMFGTSLLATVVEFKLSTLVKPVVVGVVIAFAFKSAWERALSFKPTLAASLATSGLFVLSFLYINSSVAKRFVYFAF